MHVRLTRKLAEVLNGFDLRQVRVGDVLDLSDPMARMLIAERWAEYVVPLDMPAVADDRPGPARKRRRKIAR